MYKEYYVKFEETLFFSFFNSYHIIHVCMSDRSDRPLPLSVYKPPDKGPSLGGHDTLCCLGSSHRAGTESRSTTRRPLAEGSKGQHLVEGSRGRGSQKPTTDSMHIPKVISL